jgi:hypothetical protein
MQPISMSVVPCWRLLDFMRCSDSSHSGSEIIFCATITRPRHSESRFDLIDTGVPSRK